MPYSPNGPGERSAPLQMVVPRSICGCPKVSWVKANDAKRLSHVLAKLSCTASTAMAISFVVMSLERLLRQGLFFFLCPWADCRKGLVKAYLSLWRSPYSIFPEQVGFSVRDSIPLN